ncbi:MAG: SwmB domain-containing protein, partial [Actinomycetes bacterium]
MIRHSRPVRKLSHTILAVSLLTGTLTIADQAINTSPAFALTAGGNDATFTTNIAVSPPNAAVKDIAIDGSGNIYVGYSNLVKKYDSTGTLVWTSPAVGTINSIAVDSSSRVIVGTSAGVARLSAANPPVVDTAFATAAGATGVVSNSVVNKVLVYPATGTTTRYLVADSGANSAKFLAGLTTAGALDGTFTQNGAAPAIAAAPTDIALDGSGNIYIVGGFTSFIKRLSPTGTLATADNTFNTATSALFTAAPTKVAVSSAGLVAVGGPNTGVSRLRVLTSAGAETTTFGTGLSARVSTDLAAGSSSLTFDSSGRLLVGGSFGLIRIKTDGATDSFFTTDIASTVDTAEVQSSDGKIVVGISASPYVKRLTPEYDTPGVPPAPTAVGGDRNAVVTVAAGTGTTPTGYTVTASPGGTTCSVSGGSGNCTVAGLTSGTSYTFTAVAINGNQTSAASTASSAVTPTRVPPSYSSAALSTNGLTITLTYSEALQATPAPTAAMFNVLVNTLAATVSSVAVSGSTVVLTMATAIQKYQAITVEYYAPTLDDTTTNAAIQDANGSDAAALTATSVTNSSTVDTTRPSFVSGVVNAAGTSVTLTYSEPLGATTGYWANFKFTRNGLAIADNQVNAATISGSTITIPFAAATVIQLSDTVTFQYIAPADSAATNNLALQDTIGNDALSMAATSLTNNSTIDTVAPTYSSSAVNTQGTKVILTYSETLNATTAGTSAFSVLVGGVANLVTAVTVVESTVELTMTTAIQKNQVVTVAYTAPASNAATSNAAIQDSVGNDAITLTPARSVTNNSTYDITAPTYTSSAINTAGTKVVLTYNEALNATTAATTAFTVLVGGVANTVTGVAVVGSTVELTVTSVIAAGRVVTVAYAAPSTDAAASNAAVQDTTGNDAISLSASSVTNNSTIDGTAPIYSSSAVNTAGTKITLTYNEALNATTAATSAFTVLVAGVPNVVTGVAAVGSTVELTVTTIIQRNQAVTVAYTAPSTDATAANSAVQDTAGNDAITLAASSVTNNSTIDTIAPVYVSAALDANGTLLTLTYDETLNATAGSIPLVGQFAVLADGSSITVNSLSVSGATVRLTLGTAIRVSQAVTVAYTAPSPVSNATGNSAIQDATGNDSVSRTASTVTNNSTYGQPIVTSAVLATDGQTVTVNFSKNMNPTSTAASYLTVVADGLSETCTFSGSTTGSQNFITMTCTPTITSNMVVTISYAKPATGGFFDSTSGFYTDSFTNLAVTNGSTVAPDVTAPVFTSAAVSTSGLVLTLTYSEALSNYTAIPSNYTVMVNGVSYYISNAIISGSTVQLSLGSSIQSGSTVTVEYAAPTPSSSRTNLALQDAVGNDAVSLTATAVTNSSTAGPDIVGPTLSTVSGSGSTVTLGFNESLGAVTAGTAAFTVFIGNDAVPVTSVSVVGANVILGITGTILSDARVSISYAAPTPSSGTANNAIQDFVGNDALNFTGNNAAASGVWTWTSNTVPATTPGCAETGANPPFPNRSKFTTLPNGVSYTVTVSGDYICLGANPESLSARGGQAADFVATGLVSEPGLYLETANGGCPAAAATVASACSTRGTLTITYSQPVTDPIVSFAGWGGYSGSSQAWTELTLTTPAVTLTKLSGTNLTVTGGTVVQATAGVPSPQCHTTSGGGSNANAVCGSLRINGTLTSVTFSVGMNVRNGTGYLDGWNLTGSLSEDFGLVPTSYDTPAASHAVGNLKLGSVVTADNLGSLYGTTNPDAVAAGAIIPNHADDGIATWPLLKGDASGSTYSVNATVAGVTGTAYLCGWIDFNRNGTFDAGERACAPSLASGATTGTISWTVPSDVTSGPTYARIRLSYDPLPIPTGKVGSGEVEDYSLTIKTTGPPVANADTSSGLNDVNQVISILANDTEPGNPIDITTVKLCDPTSTPAQVSPNCNLTTLVISGEGTYTANTDGTVTFDPLSSFSGTATPVTYQVSDTNVPALSASATITVIVGMPAGPVNCRTDGTKTVLITASPGKTLSSVTDFNTTKNALTFGILDRTTTNNLVANGDFTTEPASLGSANFYYWGPYATSLTIAGTGIYSAIPSWGRSGGGTSTYALWTKNATTTGGIVINAASNNGQSAGRVYFGNTVTQTYSGPALAFDSAGYATTQYSFTPATNYGTASTPAAINQTLATVVGETYRLHFSQSYEAPGTGSGIARLTIGGYDPLFFEVPKSNREYELEFVATSTSTNIDFASWGHIRTTTYTTELVLDDVIVNHCASGPTALPDVTSGGYGQAQSINLLTNSAGADLGPASALDATSVKLCAAGDTAPNCTATSVTIAGNGTYVVDIDGVITFTPEATFVGTAPPLTYSVLDLAGISATSTYTPTVIGLPVAVADSTSG